MDLRMHDKPRGSPRLAEAYLRGTRGIRRVVVGRVKLSVASAVECSQKGLDIFFTIEVYNSGILGTITDLSSFV